MNNENNANEKQNNEAEFFHKGPIKAGGDMRWNRNIRQLLALALNLPSANDVCTVCMDD